MINVVALICVIGSAALVIAADALIKWASHDGTWQQVLYSPKMLLCYVLYFVQIILAIIIFRSKGELSIYTSLFVVFYSMLGVVVGVGLFNERLTGTQITGIVLGMISTYLITR